MKFCVLSPDEAEDYDDYEPEEEQSAEVSLSQMLNHHRGDDDCYGEDYDYDDY